MNYYKYRCASCHEPILHTTMDTWMHYSSLDLSDHAIIPMNDDNEVLEQYT